MAEKKRVFISHSSDQKIQAQEIAQNLKNKGLDVWLASYNLELGSNFAEEITAAISSSDFFVLLLSQQSILSPHVKREVTLAIDNKLPVLPISFDIHGDVSRILPKEWVYWLAVVQIMAFEDASRTSQVLYEKILNGQFTLNKNESIFKSKQTSKMIILITVIALIGGLIVLNSFNSEPISTQSTNDLSNPEVLNVDLLNRLNSGTTSKWMAVATEGLGEESKFTTDECTIYVFGFPGEAYQATEQTNFSSNAYSAWLDTDPVSNKSIILVARGEDSTCAKKAVSVFKWAPISMDSSTFLISGGSPFERCVLGNMRDGTSNSESIAICKFQFERDGKAIPEEYLSLKP